MQFYKNNTDPTYSNPLTIMRDYYKYEVVDMVNNKVAFTNRMPRKDSKFFNFNFLIWNLKENAVAHGAPFSPRYQPHPSFLRPHGESP